VVGKLPHAHAPSQALNQVIRAGEAQSPYDSHGYGDAEEDLDNMSFPRNRPRRLRRTEALRLLVRETELRPRHLVAPLFVKEGIDEPMPIGSMPGHYQHTLESLQKEAREIAEKGVLAFVLFGVPATKDPEGSEAWSEDGVAQRGLRALRDEMGDAAVLIADLCLDEYTDHGHCGVLTESGDVDNDRTLDSYRRIAVSQSAAGADLVAPSGMMDGQVGAIREALDEAGFAETGILAYAAKYASTFYTPFREAAEGAPRFGDRKAYQMDPANAEEALREIRQDIDEGADIVMVKPALPYLDVIRRTKDEIGHPTAAYNVSGEYAMVKAAAERGWIDGRQATLEILTSIRRAGADLIITYHAKEAADWIE
jgi:porphobilinogen synthase